MREGGHRDANQTYSLVPRSFNWNSGGSLVGRRHVGFRPLRAPQGFVESYMWCTFTPRGGGDWFRLRRLWKTPLFCVMFIVVNIGGPSFAKLRRTGRLNGSTFNFGGSSNGRTLPFEGSYWGSSPCPPAVDCKHFYMWYILAHEYIY